mmetsp:Transcript_5228/g.14799  ORF Transcript_5228/g.14799 Transcript_5228/m.14799 type:complete len:286 (-) Transcript_5228:97-954(-)
MPASSVSTIHGGSGSSLCRRAVGHAPSNLGRKVMHMGVKVRPRGLVALPRLHLREPGVHVSPTSISHAQAFVIVDRSGDTLEGGSEDAVHQTHILAEKEGTTTLPKNPVRDIQDLFKATPRRIIFVEPLQPLAEKAPLQVHQLLGSVMESTARRHQASVLGICVFDQLHDRPTFNVELPVQLNGRQQATRSLLKKTPLLRSVTVHVDLLHAVGNLLFFELQPHLVAIGAPRVIVPEQREPNLGLRAAERSNQCLGARWPVACLHHTPAPSFVQVHSRTPGDLLQS